MAATGWKQLLAGGPWYHGPDRYPIAAYSEFLPPPRLGRKPYAEEVDDVLFAANDPWGWHVSEAEEALEFRPGLESLAHQLVGRLVHLGRGESCHGISRKKLEDNPYWPPELAEHVGKLAHERYVLLMPLALSRTQDDKGRVRWTLFGGSEQGPARAFWRSFFTAPGRVRFERKHGEVRGGLSAQEPEQVNDAHRVLSRAYVDIAGSFGLRMEVQVCRRPAREPLVGQRAHTARARDDAGVLSGYSNIQRVWNRRFRRQ